jgi:hypothetical protein
MVCVFVSTYKSGNKIKKKYMGGACGKYGRRREERFMHGFGGET